MWHDILLSMWDEVFQNQQLKMIALIRRWFSILFTFDVFQKPRWHRNIPTYLLQEDIPQQNEISKSEFESVIAHVKHKDQI